jgi:hypothetical protein
MVIVTMAEMVAIKTEDSENKITIALNFVFLLSLSILCFQCGTQTAVLSSTLLILFHILL